jgi:general stress protein 26
MFNEERKPIHSAKRMHVYSKRRRKAMEKEVLKSKIIEVLKRSSLAAVATVRDGKPWVRYMMIMPGQGLSLWTTTFAQSRKIQDIKNNGNINLIVGNEKDFTAPYINIQASAEVMTDIETKKAYWNDMLKAWYSGPEDANLAIIIISPRVIEYMSGDSMTPEVYVV